jgi:hypothetical protein
VSALAVRLLLRAWDGKALDCDPELAGTLGRFIEEQAREDSSLARLVAGLSGHQYVVFLADDPAFVGAAREIALKVRETVGGTITEAANARAFRHGPMETLASPVLAAAGIRRAVVLFDPPVAEKGIVQAYEDLAANHRGTSREFTLLRVSTGGATPPTNVVIPEAGEYTPLLAVVLGQMAAYELQLQSNPTEIPGSSDVLSKVVAAP